MTKLLQALVMTASTSALLLFSGCTPVPKANVTSLHSKASECRLSMKQMELALINATHQSKWQLTKQGKGSFTALRRDGSSDAKIAISHTPQRYHATYLDSHGLGYDGKQIDGTFHLWLSELDRAIKNDVAVLCARAETSGETPKSVLTPEPEAQNGVELDTPLMIESVPQEMLIIK